MPHPVGAQLPAAVVRTTQQQYQQEARQRGRDAEESVCYLAQLRLQLNRRAQGAALPPQTYGGSWRAV